MIPDTISPLISYLKGDDILASLIEGRVFGEELPENQNASMPRHCIVVRSAGGPGGTGYPATMLARVDIRCYGDSPYQARLLHRALCDSLLYGFSRESINGSLMHTANMESGGIALREPGAEWPFHFSSWIIRTATVGVS